MKGKDFILGIDPGCKGAIVAIDTAKPLRDGITMHKIPETLGELWQILAGYSDSVAVLEKIHTSPQMGVVSAGTFMHGFGALRMGLLAAGIETHEVTPQKWQSTLAIPKPAKQADKAKAKREHKRRLKERAQQQFPYLKVFDWNADALLIAFYGMSQIRQSAVLELANREFASV